MKMNANGLAESTAYYSKRLKNILWEVVSRNESPIKKDYSKFIVLACSRTGSGHLISLLRSHRQVRAHGEILGHGYVKKHEKILEDPVAYFNRNIFRNYGPNICSVGFKLFYYHARRALKYPFMAPNSYDFISEMAEEKYTGFSHIWDWLKNTATLKVIHLKRRNILKTLLSRKMAMITGKWYSRVGATSLPPICISYDECCKVFEQTREWEVEYDNFFCRNQTITVYYEDLIRQKRKETQRIFDFLEIKRERLYSPLKKQNTKPPSRMILNYDDLKEKFKNTEWEVFFE